MFFTLDDIRDSVNYEKHEIKTILEKNIDHEKLVVNDFLKSQIKERSSH